MTKSSHFPTEEILIVVIMFICFGCSMSVISQNPKGRSESPSAIQQQVCVDAAHKVLGEHAQILKCGPLNDPRIQETVAVIRTGGTLDRDYGLAISQLVILRHEAPGWRVALRVGKEITNDAGYIGIDFIDDSSPFYGYGVQFLDRRDDGKRAFVLSLSYLMKGGKVDTEALRTEIAWDDKVGRYREFGLNSEPEGFKPELKNPPHIRPRRVVHP
jgi:hypothetical protein